jgi:hypothetical protein
VTVRLGPAGLSRGAPGWTIEDYALARWAARYHLLAMALACNIDSRGKAVRFRSGLVLLLAAVVLFLAWALPTGSTVAWVVTGVIAATGAFSLFEARAGWCAVRALGFRTRY